jgi:hypothetical protein
MWILYVSNHSRQSLIDNLKALNRSSDSAARKLTALIGIIHERTQLGPKFFGDDVNPNGPYVQIDEWLPIKNLFAEAIQNWDTLEPFAQSDLFYALDMFDFQFLPIDKPLPVSMELVYQLHSDVDFLDDLSLNCKELKPSFSDEEVEESELPPQLRQKLKLWLNLHQNPGLALFL